MSIEKFPSHIKFGRDATATLEPDRFLLSFKKSHIALEVTELIHKYQLVLETAFSGKNRTTLPKDRMEINNTDKRFWVRSTTIQPITIDELAHDSKLDLEWIGPVYRLGKTEGPGGLISPLPNVLLIETKSPNKIRDLDGIFKDFGLKEIPEKSRYLHKYRYFVISDVSKNNSFEVMSELLAKKNVELGIKLENMPMLRPLCVIPNDTYYSMQWNMEKIHAGGNGVTGWDLSTGDDSTIICILDEGCDLTHPDLVFADQGINLGTMQPSGSPTGNHGTACAGIAAATINNGIGVSGVAGSCKILPIAFQNWTDTEVASGITYAVDHGARVISMSFGVYGPNEVIGGPTGWDFDVIDPAIEYAHQNNVVMCAATGNENISTYNRYPARHPLVIACGASDQDDNRKSPTSPDGEPWGANYAQGVSVVAPGVRIPTTDRRGTMGYNSQPSPVGDYYMQFNGTSSATPHVAGLVALLFSVNSALTNLKVRNIIESTAEKVGTIPYTYDPAYPNGTRNLEMGYGRINMLAAIQYILILKKPSHVASIFNRIIGSLADGNQWVITSHGLKPVPPWNPRIADGSHEALTKIVNGLIELKILGQEAERTTSSFKAKSRR